MSVKITNRTYEHLFRLPSETENIDWCIGNTGDEIKTLIDVEVGIDFIATPDSTVMINFDQREIKLMNGRNWGDYGFDINRTIKMSYFKTNTPTSGSPTTDFFLFDVVIENLYNDVLVYAENADIDDIGFEMIPTDRGTVKIHNVKFYDDRESQGIRLSYGNINNSDIESHNPNSFIDGTKTEMIFVGLNDVNDNSFHDMELIGYQSGMSILSARIRKTNSGVLGSVKYNTPPSGGVALVLPSNYASIGRSIRMDLTTTPPSTSIHNQNAMDFGGSPNPNQLFINNADFSGTRILNMKIGTIIRNNYNGGNNRTLKLILHKWKNGTAFTYDSNVVLANYAVTNEIRDIQLTFEDSLLIDVEPGDSFSIAYAYERSSPFWGSPSVLFENNFGSVDLIDPSGDTSYKRNYQIEIKSLLSSFFEDRQQMIERTTPQNLFDANSLTDIILMSFFPEWNNPNIVMKNDPSLTERLGNTGWFNENFNGLTNDFTVKNLKYFNLNNQEVSTLSYGNETKVKATIAGVQNLVPGETKINFGFIWIPSNEDDYFQKTTGFHKNTKINTPSQMFALGTSTSTVFQGYSNDAAKMNSKNIIVSQINDDLIVEFTFAPTPEMIQFFENREGDRTFAIWVSVADSTLITNFSNRVNLLLDVNEMNNEIPIQGNLEGVVNKFLEHPERHDEPGVDYYDGFVEDDILSRVNFQIERSKRLTGVVYGYEVFNITTGESYILEQISVNTNQSPIVNGIQEINVNNVRGFLLPYDNNKNWVKVVRDSGSDTEQKVGYIGYFGTKIRWEDWIQRFNVPDEFFDSSLTHNGMNNDWFSYLTNGTNHQINFFIMFDLLDNGSVSRFKNTFPITFNDYDQNENIDVSHNYFDAETNANLNIGNDPETGDPMGVILKNKKTKVVLTYTKNNGDFDIGNVYCVTRIELFGGAGEMKKHQISSIWEHTQGGLLIPLENENRLKVELISPNVIRTTCLIDNEQLTDFGKYMITGRIGCYKNNNGVPIESRIYDQTEYESNYE